MINIKWIIAFIFLSIAPAEAAITAVNLTNGLQNTAGSSAATASISPGTNKLDIVTVFSQFSGTDNTPTVTGASGTWTQIIHACDATNNRCVTMFRDLSASPGSGALTIDFAGQSQSNIEWSIEEFTGTDQTGTHGSGAIVQSGSSTQTNGAPTTGITVALSALGSSSNATYGGVRANAGSAIVAGTGFTELFNNATIRSETEWAINNASVSWTWASEMVISVAAAVEIKAAGAAASGLSFLPSMGAGGLINAGGGGDACTPTSFDPTNPAGSGYQVVFQDNFVADGTTNIDMTNTGNSNFHWFLKKPFGFTTQPSTDITTDANGLVITPSVNSAQVAISTAYPNSNGMNGAQWVGTAFGRGAYFEAKFSFDGPSVYSNGFGNNGWPAFWSMDVAHWANVGGDQWPGQASGFTHFIENDFFEYDNTGNQNKWGSALVDWWGIYNVTCASGFCGIYNDGVTGGNGYNNVFLGANGGAAITWNVSTFHTIGDLWVPGDTGNSEAGYRTTYFDGQLASSAGAPGNPQINWTDGTMPAPSGTGGNTGVESTPELWSIYDTDSVIVALGGSLTLPFHVAYVRVWQKPGCGTMSFGPAPGFVVSATTNTPPGNDSNAGTLAAPFATLGKCQTAMQGSGTKTCYVRGGHYTAPTGPACGSGNCTLGLSSSDNGTTYSYWPADGYNSADFAGGSTASGNGLWALINLGGVSNFTWNGISVHDFDFAGITGLANAPTLTVENSIFYNINFIVASGPQNAAAVQCYSCSNATIAHNVVHDTASFGISISGGGTNNLLYDSNVLYNTCTQIRDCGALYTQDVPQTSTGQRATNNYIWDGCTFSGCASGGWGAALYLDDCSSHWTVDHNVIRSQSGSNNLMIHGGSNNVWSSNIVDLATQGEPVLRQQSSSCSTQVGNVFGSNIIISNGAAGGYVGTGVTIPTDSTHENLYWNYGSGTLSSSGDGSPVTGSDPKLSCYNYTVGPTSPARSSPVGFTDLPRGWGPPGYVLPSSGTPPSQPHAC